MKSQTEMFQVSLNRPRNFFKLDAQEQWAIDKSLGILDWEGGCLHSAKILCSPCKKTFDVHFEIDGSSTI